MRRSIAIVRILKRDDADLTSGPHARHRRVAHRAQIAHHAAPDAAGGNSSSSQEEAISTFTLTGARRWTFASMALARASAWGVGVKHFPHFRRRLDETEYVAIRVAYVELRSLRSIWHLARWDREGNARSRQTTRKHPGIAHDNTGV